MFNKPSRRSPRGTRRQFLMTAGPASGLSLVTGRPARAAAATRETDVYARLGLRPVINAAATYTGLGGSVMPREVVQAMEQASRHFVSLAELHAAVGKRLAGLLGAEAALVTSGTAGALLQGTAACIAGKDREKIRRLPDSTGMKNQVIIQKAHRFDYDHAMRTAGARLVEVETEEQLRAAIGKDTALLFFLNHADAAGKIRREPFVRIGREAGIPTMIDAAADVPPPERLSEYLRMGFDLVAFSGGKGLMGPQCSGMLLGRKELIEAAFLNGPPHSDTVARAAKVGKEEIVGLLTAVELYLQRDHRAEWRRWEERVRVIANAAAAVPGVRTETFVPEIANQTPHLRIAWDGQALPLKNADVVKRLREGEPCIEVRVSAADEPSIEVAVWMLRPGEERIVAGRIRRVLEAGRRGA
jgi:L-seryl-tRNA(Ser) seleniumtransferase